MDTLETVIWSVMLGGLLTLGAIAVVDVLMSRTLAAWRGLLFMGITGTSCVLLSGLPEDLFPGLPVVPVLVLKSTLGPLSGVMVLVYLKQWLGVAAEDRMVHHTINWGSIVLLAGTLVISIQCMVYATRQIEILLVAAAFNALAVLLATATAVRAAQLGDKLARTMVVACLALAVSLSGLFGHQLMHDQSTLPVWIATAFSTVVFFLIMVSLGLRRNRQLRRLQRLAGLAQGMDPATGLPRGSVLLSKIDDTFWRSHRLGTRSVVMCLHLRNLYALGDEAGHSVDQQILATTAARIRRAMGFRCLVGLYHPRCFVVVLSAVKQPKVIPSMAARLSELLNKPMDVLGTHDSVHAFHPQLSIGFVTVESDTANPAEVIDQAEQRALENERQASDSAREYEQAGPTLHSPLQPER